MADEKSEETNEETKSAPGGGKILYILVGLNAVAVLGAGAAIALSLAGGKSEPPPQEEVPQVPAPLVNNGPMIKLEPFIVNLDEPEGNRYVKLQMTVELANEQAQAYLDAEMPRIRDSLIAFLSSQRMEDVRGAPGKQRIKQGAQERIVSLAPGSVRQVYITDFVVQ